MSLRKWEDLPENMRVDEVRPYFDVLAAKRGQLVLKRIFDIAGSSVLLVLLSPVYLVLAIAIKVDSPGPVFFRQERVTRYGKTFHIFKFRTMVADAEARGAQVTGEGDPRVTRVGSAIRRLRLDETSQLIDILRGTMSFVGTRPEVPKYVDAYTPEMRATLLMPAGVTSSASIAFKDEAELLKGACDVDAAYVGQVLPEKMRLNLQDILKFSPLRDLKLMFSTVAAVSRFDDAADKGSSVHRQSGKESEAIR